MISIKLMKNEMYDLFEQVFALMIVVKNDSIKKLTKEIVLNFLQNYPLSEKLLETVVLKLVNNLEYVEADGRKTAISIFERLFEKVPLEAIRSQLEVIVFGFTVRLVNEEVESLKEYVTKVLTLLLSKIHSDEDYKEVTAKMFTNCGQWLSAPDSDMKRAGLQLLRLLFSVTGQVKKVEATLEAILSHLDALSDHIVFFWANLANDMELKDTLKANQWKDVYWEESPGDSLQELTELKNTKYLVIDYLGFLETIMTHPKIKQEDKSRTFETFLKISRHPDEDVQVLVLNAIGRLIANDETRRLVREQIKQVLICLFAALKSKQLRDEVIPALKELFKQLTVHFAEIPKLLMMVSSAVSSINFKFLRFYTKFAFIINKCMAVMATIIRSKEARLSEEEVTVILGFYIRMSENGFIKENRDVLDRIEEVGCGHRRTLSWSKRRQRTRIRS
jgi:hypothetical protein